MFEKRLPNFKVNSEDLIYPTLAIIDYLKSINFNKELIVIGEPVMKDELKAAGFNLAKHVISDFYCLVMNTSLR